ARIGGGGDELKHAAAKRRRRGPPHHLVFAPCATQEAISARSSSVICVRLPIGMYLLPTVSAIFPACAAIWSGVSSTTPLGACAKPSCFGAVAWHGTQRCAVTGCTCAK